MVSLLAKAHHRLLAHLYTRAEFPGSQFQLFSGNVLRVSGTAAAMAPAAPPMSMKMGRFGTTLTAHNPLTEQEIVPNRPAGTIFKRVCSITLPRFGGSIPSLIAPIALLWLVIGRIEQANSIAT